MTPDPMTPDLDALRRLADKMDRVAAATVPGGVADVDAADLRAWSNEAPAAVLALLDRLRQAEADRDAARKNLGNLLAVIFGDGGHRQAEIGDDAKAVGEALAIWYAAKADRDAARAAVAAAWAVLADAVSIGEVRYKADFASYSPWPEIVAAEATARAALAPRGGG